MQFLVHWTKKLKGLSDLQETSQIAREDGTINSGFLPLTFNQVPFAMRTKGPGSEVGDMQVPLGAFWLCLVVSLVQEIQSNGRVAVSSFKWTPLWTLVPG